MRGGGKIPLVAQRARREALASAARHRPLLPDERREAENLNHRAYMRAWRSAQRDAELAQKQRRANNRSALR